MLKNATGVDVLLDARHKDFLEKVRVLEIGRDVVAKSAHAIISERRRRPGPWSGLCLVVRRRES